MKRKIWTEKEYEILYEFYADSGARKCADLLDRSIDSIKHKARALGINSNYNKRWSPEEDQILINNYSNLGGPACVNLLTNRSYDAVNCRSTFLGLHTNYSINPKWTNEEYLNKLIEMEVDIMPLEEYKGSKIAILHTCYNDHEWKVQPQKIIAGAGCPHCMSCGFNKAKPAILYYVKIIYENLTYYKIGVTNRSVAERFIGDRGKQIIILNIQHFDTGEEAKKQEISLLNKYKEHRQHIRGFLKSGNTELFEFDVLALDK